MFKNIFSKIVAIYETLWNNTVKPGGHIWQLGACTLHAGYLKL